MAAEKQDARAKAEQRVGQTLNNKWRIDRVLDLGGMAAVFAATHRNGKRVAIKMLNPTIAANPDLRDRFLREGYVANKVEHRGAVQVLDDDSTADGTVFLVMELLEGESLERRVSRAPEFRVPIHEVLGIADQVLDVLAAFHACNVIHRDIKPGNLFITESGVVKVLDFGLARMREPSSSYAPTAMGIVLGTVSYMPSEQAQGKSDEIDVRSDLYAVGAVMFHAMAGKVFVQGKTATERLFNAMRLPAPPLESYLPGVPDYVAAVVDKALAFDKKDRWPDANAMRAAVRHAYGAFMLDAGKRSRAPAALAPSRAPAPILAPAVSVAEALAAGAATNEVSISLDEGSISGHLEEVSSFDVVAVSPSKAPPLPARASASPASQPLTADSAKAVDALFKAAMEPSIVIDVSFGGEVTTPTPKE
jgi:serine/threonine-protein kinase